MTTQDYLKQVKRFEVMMQRKQNEVKRLDILAHSVKSPTFDPNKVQSSLKGDTMASTVAKLIDAEKQVSKLMNLYLEKREYIISQIDKLPSKNSYVILIDRYVEDKTYGEIAYTLKCSERWVKKQHEKALKEFEEIYGDEYLDNPTIFS